MDLILQTLVNGILIGGVYLIITLGFNLAFGVLSVIDFAVGEWVMLGAFTGYWLNQYLGIDPLAFLPVVFLVFVIVGFIVYPMLHRLLQGRQHARLLMVFVFTFGLATFLRGSALTAWSFNQRSMESFFSARSVHLASLIMPQIRLVAFAFGVLVTIGIAWMLYRTRFGLSVRAVAQDEGKARLMGVNTKRVSATVYALYAGLTGMAGVLIGVIYTVTPQMGAEYTIFAFFIAVLAGLGYVPGVLLAAVLLGLIQAFVAVYVGAAYALLIVFLSLYVILLVAPRGILNRGKV